MSQADSPGKPAESDPPSALRMLLTWAERGVFVVLLLFVVHRLGPQLSALTGLGPIEGSKPIYSVELFDGTRVTSDDLLGKVVILNVWATWCPPCRVEIPALQRLHEEHASGEEVVVLGLATDVHGASVVQPFLTERGVSYRNGILDGTTRRALGGITHTPTTYVIGPDGVVRHKVLGFFAPPAMRAAVDRLREGPE